MVVYLDLLFLLNFALDGATLLMTARTRKIRANFWRIGLAACIGACYVLLIFFPALSFLFTFVVKCLFSVFMIMTAFGFVSLQYFLRNLGAFYIVNFAAAGCIMALHYLLQSSGKVLDGILFTQSGGLAFRMEIGAVFIIVAFAAAMLLYRVVFQSAKRQQSERQLIADVKVTIGDYETACAGLIDTGNRLYDPLTRIPVMVMEAGHFASEFPESWLTRIRSAEVDQIVTAIGTDECRWQDRLRLIPYRGVNRGTQFMLALKPDKVMITHCNETIETGRVLIGLDGGKLSADGSYEAIIHPALLE